MTKVFIAKEKADLERCYPVMRQLRPHLSLSEYLTIYEQAQKHDGYEIVALENEGTVMAVMGYRILYDFVRGKHVYIDDLVSSEEARSLGLGARLLKHAEEMAIQHQCKSLRLCTGLENEGGIRFYKKNGWTQRSYAFTKKTNLDAVGGAK
jgi:ribosomal protein S18 acetylase RimI-like enzyme